MQGPRDQSLDSRHYRNFPPKRARKGRRPRFGWTDVLPMFRFGLAEACSDVVSCYRRLDAARNSVHYNI